MLVLSVSSYLYIDSLSPKLPTEFCLFFCHYGGTVRNQNLICCGNTQKYVVLGSITGSEYYGARTCLVSQYGVAVRVTWTIV